jgi:septal ring factor EnvC (AmiA/AmiB activator)
MRTHRHYRRCRRTGLLALVLVCGCAMPPMGPQGDTGFAAGFRGPKSSIQPPPPQIASPNEQVAQMAQRLAVNDDDRKVMAARLQQAETQLHEKEKMVVLANYEVQEAVREVKQTREEMVRYRQEMEQLRAQLYSVERENKGTLEAVIHTLEQFMDRERVPGTSASGTR